MQTTLQDLEKNIQKGHSIVINQELFLQTNDIAELDNFINTFVNLWKLGHQEGLKCCVTISDNLNFYIDYNYNQDHVSILLTDETDGLLGVAISEMYPTDILNTMNELLYNRVV